MAVYDRWYRTEKQADGTRKKVRSDDYGCKERWQVRWRDEQGRQRKQSHERKVDAEQAEAKIRTQLDDGTYVDPSAGQVTFRVYAEQWRRARMHDLSTAERIESALRCHAYSAEGTPGKTAAGAPAIGDYPLRTLAKTPSLLQGWIAGLALHPNTVRKVVGDVSQVFAAAVADRIIPANPLASPVIQRPKAVKTEAVPWTAAQVRAVAAELAPRLAAMPYLGAACGLRQGELFAVALEDVDFLRRTLHVAIQVKFAGGAWYWAPVKNRKARTVPITSPVIPVLSEHLRRFPAASVTLPWGAPSGKPTTRELLFTWPGTEAIKRTGFNPAWIRAWKRAGVPDRGPLNGMHVLRHTAASQWLSKGLGLAKVAAYLGDTQEVVLRTYSHFLPGDDDRARDIMAEFFAEPASGPSARDVPRASR
jgi:integrase